MPDVLFFESSPEVLAELTELAAKHQLLERCEFHWVMPGTDVAKALREGQPRVVVTSWRGIGGAVVLEAAALPNRPRILVASHYPEDEIRCSPKGDIPDKVVDKFEINKLFDWVKKVLAV